MENESSDWVTLLPEGAKLPLFLREYENPFHAESWPDRAVYYLQFRSNEDEPGHPIGPFVARVRREIAEANPRTIVLDLRLDQGGNFTTTASLMEDLTHLSQAIEHVYVLKSSNSQRAPNRYTATTHLGPSVRLPRHRRSAPSRPRRLRTLRRNLR